MTSVATSEGDLGQLASTPDTGIPPEVAEALFADSDESAGESVDLDDCGEASVEPSDLSGVRAINDLEYSAFTDNQVAVVDGDGLRAMGEVAVSLGYMWVALEPPGPQHRGRLGLYLEEAIEFQLEERGALPPGIQASTGLDASLSDQLYRARLVEMRGIALGIPTLEGISNLGRSLDAEDSAVLRWWLAAAVDRPVHVVISSENTKLRVYPSPVLFETLFDVAPLAVTPLPPSPSMAESAESMEMSDLPPAVEQTNVLGTKVATIEELHGVESLEDDRFESEYDEDSLMGVDLPDLDRALGLTPPVEEQVDRPRAEKPVTLKAKLRADVSPQLPLDYESPVPAQVNTQSSGERPSKETRIASPAPPPEAEVETYAGSEFSDEAPEFEASVEDEFSAAPSAVDEDAEIEASGEVEAASFDRDEEPNEDVDLGDDIDADEFLRTLKEDSSKAPEVEPVVEQAPVAQAAMADELDEPEARELGEEPSPLPTKKIARNPFIRMANPAEAVDDPSLADVESPPEPIEPKTGAAAPRAVHEATLSGAAAPDPNDPFNQLASREWKTWVTNLEAARGPKPLSVIERMFVTDYTRLREAVRRGVAETSANGILDEWQESFSKSYSEAFDALRVRGKRPTMVLDIPEMAKRLGRLQGAKRVQLLLVDGLRFDLGLMVQDRMREKADAALTERLLLWSALPSVTTYQLELLGKGPDGLKQPGDRDEAPALVARGEAALVPRRVRTGSLELYKLDVVEDRLREVGTPIVDRMDEIAADTADAICAHLNKQAPRTMVVVFGDHGFALDPKKAGTSEEASQGGSSPEEVLVPAFAWLTGAVH